MNIKEWQKFMLLVIVFLAAYYIPFSAAKELGVDAEIVKVEKINDILSYGVMVTPVLAIDGDVKIAGKIPNPKQIAEWIKAYSA